MTEVIFPHVIESAFKDDDGAEALRILVIDPEDDTDDLECDRDAILAALKALSRDDRSQLALALSLCPLHECDYAICFDDEDVECVAIRKIFPTHDT